MDEFDELNDPYGVEERKKALGAILDSDPQNEAALIEMAALSLEHKFDEIQNPEKIDQAAGDNPQFMLCESGFPAAQEYLVRLPGYSENDADFFVALIQKMKSPIYRFATRYMLYRAVEKFPDHPVLLERFVEGLVEGGDFEFALAIIEAEHLTAAPPHIVSTCKALCYIRLGDLDKGLELRKQAIEATTAYLENSPTDERDLAFEIEVINVKACAVLRYRANDLIAENRYDQARNYYEAYEQLVDEMRDGENTPTLKLQLREQEGMLADLKKKLDGPNPPSDRRFNFDRN